MVIKVIFAIILLFIIVTTVEADTLVLKNGSKVECNIIKETDKSYVVEVEGGRVEFSKDEVQTVSHVEVQKKQIKELVCDLNRGTLGNFQIGKIHKHKDIIDLIGTPDNIFDNSLLKQKEYSYYNKGIIVVLTYNFKITQIFVYYKDTEEFDGYYRKFGGEFIPSLKGNIDTIFVKQKFGILDEKIIDPIYDTPEWFYRKDFGELSFCFNKKEELILIILRK